jgi:phenylpropionate dioxygenase-like ring-hydroxylating dioxygenase large terminal subunit
VSAELEPAPGEPAPSLSKGHLSATRVLDGWYVACRSHELGEQPLAVTVLGTPLALFRGAFGRPGAVLDRCPHRNFPLSRGVLGPALSSAATTAGSSTAAASAAGCPG